MSELIELDLMQEKIVTLETNNASFQERIKILKTKTASLESLNERIVKLETDYAFLKTENASLKTDNASLNERISILWKKNMELETKIRRLEEVRRMFVLHSCPLMTYRINRLNRQFDFYVQGGWTLPCERIQQSCRLDSDTILADAEHWMSDKGKLAEESCDKNAKLCWALIVGQCDKAFVDIPFGGNVPEDIPRGRRLPLEVVNEFKQTLLNKCDTFVLLIRFISKDDPVDGHTLLLHKQGNSIITFQAYRDKSKLKIYIGDKSENAFKSAMQNEPITSETFGVVFSDNVHEEAWEVAEKCVSCFKQM
jgi:hypothetical protein